MKITRRNLFKSILGGIATAFGATVAAKPKPRTGRLVWINGGHEFKPPTPIERGLRMETLVFDGEKWQAACDYFRQ